MNRNHKESDRTAGIVKHSCGILFMLFSFAYLYFLQGELISKAQYVFSGGVTTYSFFWGALILTILLRLLQIPVQRYVDVPLRFHALTYIPSILFLTVICDVNSAVYSHFSLGWWWLGIPVVLAIFYLFAKGSDYLEGFLTYTRNPNRLSPYMWPNCLVLICLLLWCGTCHSSSDVDMYEQRVERLLTKGEYEQALDVGKNSLNTNIRLSNLRMYALSQTGQLPDRIFDYPQYYGIDGLLCVNDTNSRVYRIDLHQICSHLGCLPDSAVTSTSDYLDKALMTQQLIADSLMGVEFSRSDNPDSLRGEVNRRYEEMRTTKRRIDDYMLCGLLLNRDLETFKQKIDEVYSFGIEADTVFPVDSLPKTYREALVMIYPELGDTMMIQRYDSFLNLKESVNDSTASSNLTRRKFGNTFWWYFYNPQITQ